jgi:hypothetical protein
MREDVRRILVDWGACQRLLDELGIEYDDCLEPRLHCLICGLVRNLESVGLPASKRKPVPRESFDRRYRSAKPSSSGVTPTPKTPGHNTTVE